MHLLPQHAEFLSLILYPDRKKLGRFLDHKYQADVRDPVLEKLMPFLLEQISRDFPDHKVGRQIRTNFKRLWIRSQLQFSQAVRLSQELNSQQIPCLFFKGIALAHLHYPAGHHRAMGDIDLLVPYDLRERACQVCWGVGLGYQVVFDDPWEFRLETEQEATLRGPQGIELDLHWSLRTEELDDRDLMRQYQTQLFQRAQPLQIGQHRCWALSDEDLLVNLCARGYYCRRQVSLTWIVDAAQMWRSKGWSWSLGGRSQEAHPNWGLLLEIAKQSQVTLPFESSLSILRQLGFPIPHEVSQELRRHPVSWVRAREVRYLGVAAEELTWSQRAFLMYPIYRRQQIRRGPLGFLSAYWGVQGLGALVRLAWRKLVGRDSP